MKISINSQFGDNVGTFYLHKDTSLTADDYKDSLLDFLDFLREERLLIINRVVNRDLDDSIYSAPSLSESLEMSRDQLSNTLNLTTSHLLEHPSSFVDIDGMTYVLGEGYYQGGIKLSLSFDNFDQYISLLIKTSLTNWLEFDMSGKRQPYYLGNSARLKAALALLNPEVDWSLMVEISMYSSLNEVGDFIVSARDEDTGEPLDITAIVDYIEYEPPLDI